MIRSNGQASEGNEVLPTDLLACSCSSAVFEPCRHHPPTRFHGFEPHHRQTAAAGRVFGLGAPLPVFNGVYKNGLKFFKIFVPSGVSDLQILPLVMFIEILVVLLCEAGLAQACRPVSPTMLAGPQKSALKVFAGFVRQCSVSRSGAPRLGRRAWRPLALDGGADPRLELLVAFPAGLRCSRSSAAIYLKRRPFIRGH